MKINIQSLNDCTDSKMLLEYLIKLSQRVRQLQKAYYSTKSKQALKTALEAEKIYDFYLNAIMLKAKFDLKFDKPVQYLQSELNLNAGTA